MFWNFADKFRDWGLKYFSTFRYHININDINDNTASVLNLWKLRNPAVKIKTTIIAQVWMNFLVENS